MNHKPLHLWLFLFFILAFHSISFAQTPLPPAIIQGPAVEPDTTSARVIWVTDRPGNSVVLFGQTPALGETAVNAADTSVTDHRVLLENLMILRRYFYRVQTTDTLGQTTVSVIDSFKTRGVPDLSPPIISLGPFVLDVTPTSAVVSWTTDRRGTSVVEFDTGATLGASVADDRLELEHQLTLTNLTASTEYRYRALSTGPGGTAVSDTLRFTTAAVLDTLPPVVTVQPHVDSYAVTDTTAIISWGTDAGSDSRVLYWAAGTTDTLTASRTISTTDHRVTLTRLTPGTTYAYIAQSTRLSTGRFLRSRMGRFTTLPAGQAVRLDFVVSPELVYRTDTRVVFQWKTNVPSDGFVFYAPDPGGAGVFNFDESFVRGSPEFNRKHIVAVGGLTPGMSYIFVVTSSAPNGTFLVWPPNTVFARVVVEGGRPALKPTGILQVPGSEGRFTTNAGPDTQAPVILGGPSVISRTADRVVVQWVTDEISNSVVRFGAGGVLTSTVQDPLLVTLHQVTIPNLNPNTSIDYVVSSTDPSNNGPAQSAQSVVSTTVETDTEPPVIIEDSIVAIWSDTRATLRWRTNEAANSLVFFGTGPDSIFTTVSEPEASVQHSITVTDLIPSQTYFYKIASSDIHGNGPTPSSTKVLTTRATADTARLTITGLEKSVVAAANGAVMTLSWTTDRLGSSFVEYDTTTSLGQAIGSQKGAASHRAEIPGLKLDTTYYFRVGSVNTFDARVPAPRTLSALDSIRTPAVADAVPPTTPGGVTAIAGDRQVRLSWLSSTDVSGIAGYTITRNGVSLVTAVEDTVYLDDTAQNGAAYGYTVIPVDRAGNTGIASAPTPNVTPGAGRAPSAPAAIAMDDTVSLRPVLLVSNATPATGDATRLTPTYTFQVSTDSLFSFITIAQTGIAQGTPSNPTHWQVLDAGQPDSTALEDGIQYWWRARAFDGVFFGPWSASQVFVASAGVPSGIDLEPALPPQAYALYQNYPNPFNPATAIRFDLPKPGLVTLRVYNLLGQEVITLIDGARMEAGTHTVRWNGRNRNGAAIASGVYFYRLRAGDFVQARKMLLIR